jgi:hypothetical protein
MSRAIATRLAALEARAAQIEAAKIAFDLSSLTDDELKAFEVAIFAHHGRVTDDEAWLLVFDDCYWRHEAKDVFDPRFRAAARRAIAAKAERYRKSLLAHEPDVPAEMVERLERDTPFMRRVVERARAFKQGWCSYPGHREMAQALRELVPA